MHSTSKLILFVLGGVVFGAALTIGGLLFFLRSDAGRTLVRNYIVSQAVVSAGKISATADSGQAIQPTANTTILVPKAYADQDYYTSINAAVRAYNDVVFLTGKLAPILLEINIAATSGDFNKVIDSMIEGRLLVEQADTATNAFGQKLTALSAANQNTKDAVTKSLTFDLLARGDILRVELDILWPLLSTLLSGEVPTESTLSSISGQRKKIEEAAAAFSTKAQELIQTLSDGVRKSIPKP